MKQSLRRPVRRAHAAPHYEVPAKTEARGPVRAAPKQGSDQSESSPPPQVCRYIRHRVTQHYYTEGGWTLKVEEAQAFSDSIQAARTCVEQGLTEVDLVLRFGRSGSDLFCTPAL